MICATISRVDAHSKSCAQDGRCADIFVHEENYHRRGQKNIHFDILFEKNSLAQFMESFLVFLVSTLHFTSPHCTDNMPAYIHIYL